MSKKSNIEIISKINSPRTIWTIIIFSGLTHLLIYWYSKTSYINWKFSDQNLHAVIEVAGFFTAFIVGMFLFHYERNDRGGKYNYLIATSLITMAVFDLFHALVEPGKVFVWLHSLSVFLGGILFSLICIPKDKFVNHFKISIKYIVTFTLFASGLSIFQPKFIPEMLTENTFSNFAVVLNVIGGICFLIAALHLIYTYFRFKNTDDLLFALHCLIFSSTALMFQQSSLWDFSWWGWHILRFLAYAFALWYIIHNEVMIMHELNNHLSILESSVNDRTLELSQSNKNLHSTLQELTLTQERLIQVEKMASLGKLVAGVAHELNTPLGICITSSSTLKDSLYQLSMSIDNKSLTQGKLNNTINLQLKTHDILSNNLNKFTILIDKFKSIAMENHLEKKVKINLFHHSCHIVSTVSASFNNKPIEINIDINKQIEMFACPSVWGEILTILLTNSFEHGFEIDKIGKIGKIKLSITQTGDSLILNYEDNGSGISPDILPHIFEPFITTKRGNGHSGLGMHIVFNLVHSFFNGTIKCVECKEGCFFEISIPLTFVNG